ncbi:unnamed protein product, partial [Ilex paraguariensis]
PADAIGEATIEPVDVGEEASTKPVDTDRVVVAEAAGEDREPIAKNEIIRVYQLTYAKTTSFSTLVTRKNLFRFGISPNSTVISVAALNLPPLIIEVDSFSTGSDEDAAISSRGKRKHRQGKTRLKKLLSKAENELDELKAEIARLRVMNAQLEKEVFELKQRFSVAYTLFSSFCFCNRATLLNII